MDYQTLISQLESLFSDETDEIAILANTSALLMDQLDDVNWVGFYLWNNGELVLGPFQGKPACMRIPFGEGVCGTAFARNETVRVADVHAFHDHIACDAGTNSEIVLLLQNSSGEKYGVLDIDSKRTDRFSEDDQTGLELVAAVLGRLLGSPNTTLTV